MNINEINRIDFLGIGGIGMSAIARYLKSIGKEVYGYDKVQTELTIALENEGIHVRYTEDPNVLPEKIDLVVITPAIPKDHAEWLHYQNTDIPILKRAEILGLISKGRRTITVAGTHGKTTTSTLLTYILHCSGIKCSAFLGGISVNFDSNYIQGDCDWVVMEADEYDRSFLQLYPEITILTSLDADHLDIYGNHNEMIKTYHKFLSQVQNKIILHQSITADQYSAQVFTYGSGEGADFQAVGIASDFPGCRFDFKSDSMQWEQLKISMAGEHNIENATAAISVALQLGCSEADIRTALSTFKGIKRRFEWIYSDANFSFIDDYAHHPSEIKAAISAVRLLFPEKKITGIFQPHLFSRTKDFADGFAQALDSLDQLYLLEIYPAREMPMEGVNSQMLLNKMHGKHRSLLSKSELMQELKKNKPELLLSLGAGDIGAMVSDIKEKIYLTK